MESLDLTTPVVVPTLTQYRITRILLDWYGQLIEITLRGTTGEIKTHNYSGGPALVLMNQLNTMNLSTISLHKRILNRLVADGVLAGGVSGSPD